MQEAVIPFEYVVIGGGIIGLSTVRALVRQDPEARVALLEAEPRWAAHQSGHNSNVIHSGIYYTPGSAKALLARFGGDVMAAYCEERGLPLRRSGKLIAATSARQLPHLDALAERGRLNGVRLTKLDRTEVQALEPNVRAVAGLEVHDTGLTQFGRVCESLADEAAAAGVELRRGFAVDRIEQRAGSAVLHSRDGDSIEARTIINCAGLHSDRVARLCGVDPGVRIQPFRGEYSTLAQHDGTTVGRPVYPVPDPELPFLGVHITPGLDGTTHVGPNAVPAFARHGYRWRDVEGDVLAAWLHDPAMRALARSYWRDGITEMSRSVLKPLLVRSVRELVPATGSRDLRRAGAGVRAQAVDRRGRLVDDFVLRTGPRSVHVLNAPSPAATSGLTIGAYVAALARAAESGENAPTLPEFLAAFRDSEFPV